MGSNNLTAAEKLEQLEDLALTFNFEDLVASHKWLGKRCFDQNVAYLACKQDSTYPDECLEQAQRVQDCSTDLFKDLNAHCKKELKEYSNCLLINRTEFANCRKESSKEINYEKQFHECVMKVYPKGPTPKFEAPQ